MAITKNEVAKGLVLHLDPECLVSEGATYSCSDERRVKGGHFFLCIRTNGVRATMLPLYSEDGPGRTELAEVGRTGHDKWVHATCFWHEEQVWDCPVDAIVKAATAGKDQSTRTSRNVLAKEHIPSV